MDQQFHFYVTEHDGKEAVWFHDIDRDKLVIRRFSIVFKDRDPDGKRWAFDIPYKIDLGVPIIESYLSDWTTDLELIRHSIEHYVFTGETKIELNFEDSPTEIMLKRIRALEKTVDVGPGTAYYWKKYASVIVTPNSFLKGIDSLFGFCEEKQVIKEIYEALLNVGRTGYKYEKGYDDAWGCSPMVFYNKIKSPIIEDFITGKDYKEDETQIRQVNIDHILNINADVLAFLWDERGAQNGGADIDDVVEFSFDNDENDYKVLVPGIYNWHRAYEDATDFADCRVDEKFDLEEWNRHGLELAKVMRRGLPSNIDLWYCYPFEDEKNRDKRPVLIYNE